jgi:phosphoglycolate phosphatase
MIPGQVKSMRKYDAVIWDWNGTLLDDVDLVVRIVNELFTEYGVPSLTPCRYKQIFDFPVRLYYERAGLDFSKHDFRQVSEKFCARFEERVYTARLFSGVPRILETLRQAGVRQFILSGTEQQALHRMVGRYGLAALFDTARGLDDHLAAGKVDAGHDLVDRYQIETGRAVMIGDTAHDAEVARELGMECLLVASGHHSPERLSGLGFPVFDSLSALSPSILSHSPIS